MCVHLVLPVTSTIYEEKPGTYPCRLLFYHECVILILIRPAPVSAPGNSSLPELPDHGVKQEYGGHHEWTDLCVPPEELRPSATLITGQCFNWRQASSDCWVGVLGRDVIAIRCEEAAPGHRHHAIHFFCTSSWDNHNFQGFEICASTAGSNGPCTSNTVPQRTIGHFGYRFC